MGGHADVLAGAIVTNSDELGEQLKYLQNATGGVLAPFHSWLIIRSIETLKIGVERHSENALKVAEFLEGRQEIKNIYYPGLKNHPGFHIATKQQKLPGGIISFSLKKIQKRPQYVLLHQQEYSSLQKVSAVLKVCFAILPQ